MKCAGTVLVISVIGVVLALNAAQQKAAAQAAPEPKAAGQLAASPEVVDVRSGALTLRAQVWRPSGNGPFPAVLFNHGSYSTDDPLPPSDPETLGPVFARHGYVFLWLHRQGTGLSSAQGVSDGDQMARALQAEGAEGRNRVQLQLLEHEQMDEAAAALARLRARGDVDAQRIGVVGHSFGGSLSVLMAARDPKIRAAVIFGGAAGSWNQSAELRERLLAAVARMSAPAFFIHAVNDYSTAPGPALAAEMQRLGKPHALKIYPPYGADTRAGHNLVFRSVRTWESDVFAFLDAHLDAERGLHRLGTLSEGGRPPAARDSIPTGAGLVHFLRLRSVSGRRPCSVTRLALRVSQRERSRSGHAAARFEAARVIQSLPHAARPTAFHSEVVQAFRPAHGRPEDAQSFHSLQSASGNDPGLVHIRGRPDHRPANRLPRRSRHSSPAT